MRRKVNRVIACILSAAMIAMSMPEGVLAAETEAAYTQESISEISAGTEGLSPEDTVEASGGVSRRFAGRSRGECCR